MALDARGGLLVGGQVLEGAKASAWWADQARARRAGSSSWSRASRPPRSDRLGAGPGSDELPTVVIVRADRDASYGMVRRTLAEAQERGFANFSLVVLLRNQP